MKTRNTFDLSFVQTVPVRVHVVKPWQVMLRIRIHQFSIFGHNQQLLLYVGGESEARAWQKYLLVNKLDINTI